MDAVEIVSAQEFGAYLRELRGQLTQQAVARRSNVDRAALTRQRVSNIENGAVPTAQQLRCYLHGCGRLDLLDELEPVRRRIEASAAPAKDAVHPAGARRRVPRRLAVSVAAAVTAAAVTGVAVGWFMGGRASEGTAAAGVPDCVEGSVCFWPEPNFLGRKITLPPDYFSDSRCQPLPFVARSVQNTSKERQRLFAGTGCTGQVTILQHLNRAPLPSVAVLSYHHS
ncbi:peptidase inhibitor family I36 protein [Actinomadura oligospora]|uniref:peptidase inhibitor family I36 protein n=1 Tax=Actinomadura oligospora TaxID=111804 RepID=UPI0004ACB64F|nr:peptidase inhibitor family I36 protein [Actinomadura oligospora]